MLYCLLAESGYIRQDRFRLLSTIVTVSTFHSTVRPAWFVLRTRRVQGHEHRAVEEVTGRVDELRYFLGTQDLREFAIAFGSRNIFEQIASLQRLDIEESKRGHMLLHGAGVQLLLLKQVGLILTQVLRTELVGSLMEMAGKFLDD